MGRDRRFVLSATSRKRGPNGNGSVAGQHGETYRVLLDTPEMVVLRRDDHDRLREDPPRVLHAGEIVSRHSVLELVSTTAACRWTGDLRIYGERSVRVLGFHEGALRHTKSDHPEDRLDKVVARIGVLRPSEIESLVREQEPGQRFGELLLERGIVEQAQLFAFLRRQMEQTLLSAVLVEEGCYVFMEADEPREPPSATARIPLQTVLLTAAERLDLFASYQGDVPDDEARPETRSGVDVTRFNDRERLVLAYSDGSRSVRQIASETWLGRFQTFEILSSMVRADRVRLLPPRPKRSEVAHRIVQPFNEMLAEISESLSSSEDVRAYKREVTAWAETSAPVEDLKDLLDDAAIDAERMAARLANGVGRSRVEELKDAFHELTAYALFSAGIRLPRDRETELASRINRRLSELGGP